jgi:phosphate acetyltransferase
MDAKRVNSHERYERLIAFAKGLPPVTTAVAHPCDAISLESVVEAAKLGLIAPILVGPPSRIRAVAEQGGLDIAAIPIVESADSHDSAAKAVVLIREGKAEALMKGSLHTDELMAEVVARDSGIRTSRRISHCFVNGRFRACRSTDHHRCRGQYRAQPGGQGRYRAERD